MAGQRVHRPRKSVRARFRAAGRLSRDSTSGRRRLGTRRRRSRRPPSRALHEGAAASSEIRTARRSSAIVMIQLNVPSSPMRSSASSATSHVHIACSGCVKRHAGRDPRANCEPSDAIVDVDGDRTDPGAGEQCPGLRHEGSSGSGPARTAPSVPPGRSTRATSWSVGIDSIQCHDATSTASTCPRRAASTRPVALRARTRHLHGEHRSHAVVGLDDDDLVDPADEVPGQRPGARGEVDDPADGGGTIQSIGAAGGPGRNRSYVDATPRSSRLASPSRRRSRIDPTGDHTCGSPATSVACRVTGVDKWRIDMRVGRVVSLVAVSSSVMLVGFGLNAVSSGAASHPTAPPRPGHRAAVAFHHEVHLHAHAARRPDRAPEPPGASHSHDFFSNVTTNAATTLTSLTAGGTTCVNQQDHSGYWVPSLTVNGMPVQPTFANVYYQNAGKPFRTVKTIPQRPRGRRRRRDGDHTAEPRASSRGTAAPRKTSTCRRPPRPARGRR